MNEATDGPGGQPEKLRLACDTMLGKLSRGLRSLGVDTTYRRGVGGMRGYKQARGQGRVFLTRSSRLRELPGVYYVGSNDPAEQLVQVRERFGLPEAPLPGRGPAAGGGPPAEEARPEDRKGSKVPVRTRGPSTPGPPSVRTEAAEPGRGPAAGGTRCQECNVALEKIGREQARPSIPFFIYQIHHDFSRCPKCRRVYWPGSHVRPAPPQAPAGGRPRPRRGRAGGKRQSHGGKQHGGGS